MERVDKSLYRRTLNNIGKYPTLKDEQYRPAWAYDGVMP